MGSPQQFILGLKMKWTLCLLCVASVATALPARDKKAFSLFSVVTFPNAECTTDTTPAMIGICVTAEECSNDGDVIAQAQGNCASGFGVCCMRRVEGNPNAAITSGLTYVQSPQFPQAVTALNPGGGQAVAAVNRAFNIMGGPNVCQIRFDFVTTQVIAPNGDGDCANDEISVRTPRQTAAQLGIGALCGTLSNQHLIVDVERGNNAMAATLDINTDNTAAPRMWKILVKCVECDSVNMAPAGCRQYFSDASGRFTSFNGAREVAGNAHNMIRDVDYAICFRQVPGFCGVRLTQTRDSPGDAPDSFELQQAAAAETTAEVGTECTTQFIRVPDAALTVNDAGAITPALPRRVCGAFLNTEGKATASGPVDNCGYRISVFAAGDTANGANEGFDLMYAQIPCPCGN